MVSNTPPRTNNFPADTSAASAKKAKSRSTSEFYQMSCRLRRRAYFNGWSAGLRGVGSGGGAVHEKTGAFAAERPSHSELADCPSHIGAPSVDNLPEPSADLVFFR